MFTRLIWDFMISFFTSPIFLDLPLKLTSQSLPILLPSDFSYSLWWLSPMSFCSQVDFQMLSPFSSPILLLVCLLLPNHLLARPNGDELLASVNSEGTEDYEVSDCVAGKNIVKVFNSTKWTDTMWLTKSCPWLPLIQTMTIQGSSWINIISKLAGVALRAGEAVADVNIMISNPLNGQSWYC